MFFYEGPDASLMGGRSSLGLIRAQFIWPLKVCISGPPVGEIQAAFGSPTKVIQFQNTYPSIQA